MNKNLRKMKTFSNFKIYKSIVIAFTIVFTGSMNSYGQDKEITLTPKNLTYWTGRVDILNIVKLDGDIKAGRSLLNYFEGWAVIDLFPFQLLTSNPKIISLSLREWTWEISSSSSHCLYIKEMSVDPRTATRSEIINDIGPLSSYSGCDDAMRYNGYNSIPLNSTAVSKLQSSINNGDNWWAIGFYEGGEDDEPGAMSGYDWPMPELTVTYCEIPGTASVSGPSPVCQNSTQTYNATATNADSYTWTLPSGWSGSSTTSSITVTVGSSSGNVCAIPKNGSCTGTQGCKSVTVTSKPGQAIVSGNNPVCSGNTETYTASSTGATSYNWTVPSGWIITSGQGTSSIIVTAGSNSGNVCATPSNSCGSGLQGCKSVTVTSKPGQAIVSGNSPVCSGNTEIYTASSTGATSFTWTVPSNWTITSGLGTSSIKVTVGSNSGNVCATPSNCSGNGSQGCKTVQTGVIPKIIAKWGDVLICSNLGDSITNFQWYKGSSAISGATKQYYETKKQTGAYKVEIVDINGCKNSSNPISISGTKSLSVYPNPASVSFALKLNDESEGRAIVRVLNSSGIKVMEFQTENMNDELLKEIPVKNLSEGIYVVQVLLDNKDLYYTKIVVIK